MKQDHPMTPGVLIPRVAGGAHPLYQPQSGDISDQDWVTAGCPRDDESRESRMVVVERGEDGKPTVWCDPEIATLFAALNRAGVRTVASCSGHDVRPGNIMLADGRELMIMPDFDSARFFEGYYPGINGEPARNAPAPNVAGLVDWAVRSWHEQVANRPLTNVHRRTLDSVWRQVIRFAGEDDVVLIGPRHDDMLDASGNPLPEYATHQTREDV